MKRRGEERRGEERRGEERRGEEFGKTLRFCKLSYKMLVIRASTVRRE